MTSQIQNVHDSAFKVDRALLNKGGVIKVAIKHLKLADIYFVNLGASFEAAVI